MTQHIKLGDPCWEVSSVERVIRQGIAQVSAEHAHYFLAAHTPLTRLRCDKGLPTDKILTESDFYSALMDIGRANMLAVVRGEPGTGKSHLIHWAYLRCVEQRSLGELMDVVPILVDRHDGSLRYALQRIVNQLPAEFSHHLEGLRNALVHISSADARRKLCFELGLVLNRGDIAKTLNIPRKLSQLGNACAAEGYREWLSRDDGAVHAFVQRLTASSNVDERMQLPQFTLEDLLPPVQYTTTARNSTGIQNLFEELRYDHDKHDGRLGQQGVVVLNAAVRQAIEQMTGLSRGLLPEIFRSIRKELAAQGRWLAIFIEDITPLAVIDESIFTAFEPPADPAGLCRTVAVLGMARRNSEQLQENQRDRATLIVSMDEAGKSWREDPSSAEAFAARYLNAIRLSPEQIEQVGQLRRNGDHDVTISRCTECRVREDCHKAFGSVTFEGDSKVGLFPFTSGTVPRLINRLREDNKSPARRNPRGLLAHILDPILRDGEALVSRQFPRVTLELEQIEPEFWGTLLHEFCAGWSGEQVKRLKQLAEGWVQASKAQDAASQLQPLLEPLGLPKFSRKAQAAATPSAGTPAPKIDPSPRPTPSTGPTRLEQLLVSLRKWLGGQPPDRDEDFRDLLSLFVRTLAWEIQTEVPPNEWRRHLWGKIPISTDDDDDSISASKGGAQRGLVDVEGMPSPKVGNYVSIVFRRCTETFEIIESLIRFKFNSEKPGSWDFEGGERYKRRLARWQRKHAAEVRAHLKPPFDVEVPRAAAVQFLMLAAAMHKRQLPTSPAQLLESLFSTPASATLVQLPPGELQQLSENTFRRVGMTQQTAVQQFLLQELEVRQGLSRMADTRLFIDPRPVLRHACAFFKDVSPVELPADLNRGFWQTRYADAAKALGDVSKIGCDVEKMRKLLTDMARSVSKGLDGMGIGKGELKNRLREMIDEARTLLDTARHHAIKPDDGDNDVSDLFLRRPKDEIDGWAVAISDAHAGVELPLLQGKSLDASAIATAANAVGTIAEYVSAVENWLESQKFEPKDGSDSTLWKRVEDELKRIAAMAGKEAV